MTTPHDAVPEADVQEQHLDAEAAVVDPSAVLATEVAGDAERPEADAQEQAMPVEVDEIVAARPGRPRPDDVPEADWFEQSIAEPLDDEER